MHDAEMSVAAVPYNISVELGILDLDGRNIKGIIEKPKYNYYANAGIYLIKNVLLPRFQRTSSSMPHILWRGSSPKARKLYVILSTVHGLILVLHKSMRERKN